MQNDYLQKWKCARCDWVYDVVSTDPYYPEFVRCHECDGRMELDSREHFGGSLSAEKTNIGEAE